MSHSFLPYICIKQAGVWEEYNDFTWNRLYFFHFMFFAGDDLAEDRAL